MFSPSSLRIRENGLSNPFKIFRRLRRLEIQNMGSWGHFPLSLVTWGKQVIHSSNSLSHIQKGKMNWTNSFSLRYLKLTYIYMSKTKSKRQKYFKEQFPTWWNLKKLCFFKMVHERNKNFTCSLCSKSFAAIILLTNHEPKKCFLYFFIELVNSY